LYTNLFTNFGLISNLAIISNNNNKIKQSITIWTAAHLSHSLSVSTYGDSGTKMGHANPGRR